MLGDPDFDPFEAGVSFFFLDVPNRHSSSEMSL